MRLRLARRLSLEQLELPEMLSVTFQGHFIVDQSGPRSGEGGSFFPAHVVLAADIDGDDDADVVVGNNDTIYWYENTEGSGDFGFGRAVVTTKSQLYSGSVADVDGDTDLDVICATSGEISWYENTDGNGHFGPASIINSTDGEKLAQTIDLDGDGDVDILSAYHTLSAETEYFGITWWENVSLQPGDSDQDLDFDERDIEQILKSGKYLTDEPTTWAEGDWNADGVFNQEDIVAALATGNYLQGPYAAESSSIVKPTQDTVDDLFAILP